METGGIAIERSEPKGLTPVRRAYGASARGLAGAYPPEGAIGQELALAVFAIPLARWLGHERLGRHPFAGLAKDFSSAAVLMSLGLLVAIRMLGLLER